MRWSQLFIPTLREDPADAEVASHRLLLRAGYIRQLAAGIYSYLYLGQRSALKIQQIIREEMNAIGAQEFFLPALNPGELWQQTGRWQQMADIIFEFKDHSGRDVCLAPTHEEVMTEIARGELRSYKQLPQIWYQIQTKFRDEARPKSGLMRLRQFLMKDSYSFDLDEAGLHESYMKHHRAYCRIFDRCGLKYVIVEAHSGAMGGSQSHEFMVLSEAGEDQVATCSRCGYAANLEKARSRPAPVPDAADDRSPEPFDTPGVRTIEELMRFTGIGAAYFIKTLAYVVEGQLVLALLRGDHELNETKFADALGGRPFRPAHPDEIRQQLGAQAGFIGPVGVRGVRLLADEALRGRRNLITGANQDDRHLRNVTPDRDFQAEYADLRTVRTGEGCPACEGELIVSKAIEIGHIFKLGRRYAEALGARVLDAQGREVTLIMGSYGIGVERILTAAIEQNHDADGMFLPVSIAPFQVLLTPTNLNETPIREVAERLYAELQAAGIEVLYDDRDERPGVKFKDADLIGIPYRITVGRKVQDGNVELLTRSTRSSRDASISQVVPELRKLLG
ncbi:MAG: proline--tRNA ligase [Acidobacteriia bacterium]|jgi:prolyl-tRNA synthetase|nr:proline--tRNA ligase [Terriglobia bacterium]